MASSPGYQGLQESAAWFDISARARIWVRGEDRIRLLHALATNVIEGLGPGQATSTFFLNPQGRIQAFCRVYVEDDRVLLETAAAQRQALVDYVENYIIMDDVSLEDVTNATTAIALEGPLAAHDEAMAETAALCSGRGLWIWGETAPDGIPEAAEADIRLARVANRIPLFGVDYTDHNIPHETGLLQFVSFTKGCYPGQEIVERVQTQGQVNRTLRAIEVETSQVPDDLTVRQGTKQVGTLTSPTMDSEGDRMLGFCLLRREAESGDLNVDGAHANWSPIHDVPH